MKNNVFNIQTNPSTTETSFIQYSTFRFHPNENSKKKHLKFAKTTKNTV